MSWRLYKDDQTYYVAGIITEEYNAYNNSFSVLRHGGGAAILRDGYAEPHPINLKFYAKGDGLELWVLLRDYIANGTLYEFSLRYPYNGKYDLPTYGASGWYQMLYPQYGQVGIEQLGNYSNDWVITATLYPMTAQLMRRDTGGIFDPTGFYYAMPPW